MSIFIEQRAVKVMQKNGKLLIAPNPDGCLVYFSDTSFPSGSDHMTYFAKASLSNSGEKSSHPIRLKRYLKNKHCV